jgi:hypothetical protein
MNKTKVTRNSTIGKVLLGNTKGIHNWYCQYIFNNRNLFILIDN